MYNLYKITKHTSRGRLRRRDQYSVTFVEQIAARYMIYIPVAPCMLHIWHLPLAEIADDITTATQVVMNGGLHYQPYFFFYE